MARPKKNNADYFPHDNNMRDDERIKAVRRKFSHLGYSIWNMLLERLCHAEDFKTEFDEDSIDLMAGDFNIEPEQLKEVMEYLIKLKLIIKEGETIFSKTMITRFEGLIRKRKRDSERLSPAITQEKEIIASDNPQSKVKESKVKEIKEKGVKEISSPNLLDDFSFSETDLQKTLEPVLKEDISQKEKNFAKKESISKGDMLECKAFFLQLSPHYIWENKDTELLESLLKKILITKPEISSVNDLLQSFGSFLQKLPSYWRNKKFTIFHLASNYNEIVSEIKSNSKNNLPEKVSSTSTFKPFAIVSKPESNLIPKISLGEKKQIRKDFIHSIIESFEEFVKTDNSANIPLWVMYPVLVDEKILNLSKKKIEKYFKQASHENKEIFKSPENQVYRLEMAAKSLAVKSLFDDLKKRKIHIKNLFNL